jgi:hypothetical protein
VQKSFLRCLLSLIPRRVIQGLWVVKLHLVEVLNRDLLLAAEGVAVVCGLRSPLLHLVHYLLLISLESVPEMRDVFMIGLEGGPGTPMRA